MVDINFSYEDGLRLSELSGQLADYQFELTHYVEMNILFFVALSIGVGMMIALLMDYVFNVKREVIGRDKWGYKEYEPFPTCKWLVSTLAISILLGAVIIIVGLHVGEVFLMSDIANVDAQIDALYAKYGMVRP